MRPAPALVGCHDLPAGVEIIAIAQQPLDAGSKQFLFFRELDIHPIPRAMRLQAQNRFGDNVALDLVRSAVDAELARIQILFRRGMPVVRTRHEVIGAYRMLADREAIIADRLMSEIRY